MEKEIYFCSVLSFSDFSYSTLDAAKLVVKYVVAAKLDVKYTDAAFIILKYAAISI